MDDIQLVYKSALDFTKAHYENFPVVSFFLPKKLRHHVAVVYQFARQADDIADEGTDSEEIKLERLRQYKIDLSSCLNGKFQNDFWRALKNTIDQFELEPINFYNLITAFRMDCSFKGFQSFDDVLKYCSYSANPVGRIMLELHGLRNEKIFPFSDSICTALQLTNFLQDTSRDYENGRIYLPNDDLEKFHVPEKVFELKRININFKSLMLFEVNRVAKIFDHGKNLLKYLPGSLKRQIKWTILGGEKILEKIRDVDYDVLITRPVLTKNDYFFLMIKALFS